MTTFSTSWRTPTVVALAEQIRGGEWHLTPILADALEDAGADGAALSPLRDPGIADSRSGLWLAGIDGKDGLWELGQSLVTLAVAQNKIETARRRVASGDRGLAPPEKALRQVERIRSRREKLRLANTGGRGERWDECRCEKCGGDGYAERPVDPRVFREWGEACPQCGGSGDLLRRPIHRTDDEGYLVPEQPRPLSFDSGPLPVVTVRLEEVVREERCEKCKGQGHCNEKHEHDYECECGPCSGTGVIHVPSEWLRHLPSWYDVMLEGVEPYHWRDVWYWGHESWESRVGVLPNFLFLLLPDLGLSADGDSMRGFSSPAAAHAALRQGLRRWRFS